MSLYETWAALQEKWPVLVAGSHHNVGSCRGGVVLPVHTVARVQDFYVFFYKGTFFLVCGI